MKVKVGQWWYSPSQKDQYGFKRESSLFLVTDISEDGYYIKLLEYYHWNDSNISSTEKAEKSQIVSAELFTQWTKWEPNWLQRLIGYI